MIKLTEIYPKKPLKELKFSGKTIINVDIQPEYANYISFSLYDWVDFINENAQENTIVFLYNGYDTLGMISESDYIDWLFELGIDYDIIDNAEFFDKGYAFFRSCMDRSIDEDEIVEVVKYMYKHDIRDHRQIDDLSSFEGFSEEMIDFLHDHDECLSVPELMDYIKNFSNIQLLGGGVDQCLKEVELALQALEKDYNTINKFVY